MDHWVLWSDSISDILLWRRHPISAHFLHTSRDFGGPEEFEGQLTFNMSHAVIAPLLSPAYKLEVANRVANAKHACCVPISPYHHSLHSVRSSIHTVLCGRHHSLPNTG